MATPIDRTFERLAVEAAAVGLRGLRARAEATHAPRDDLEQLAQQLAVADDEPRVGPCPARQLALLGYRLARGLLGPLPAASQVSGDDIVDLVEGGTLFGRAPSVLLDVAEGLLRESVPAHECEEHGDVMWRAFDVGVVVAVTAAGLSSPGTSHAA